MLRKNFLAKIRLQMLYVSMIVTPIDLLIFYYYKKHNML